GIQFHPESLLTPYGMDILRNFILIANTYNERRAIA
ncbi:MAG: aminodeoxychorismate/anthranilate synthase component II, partial [Alphaproteobacteria bacterium]|nr:aminodeoxychorismate/anthranilate synthase component II [Alphaproteobacteria bacterium]